jgi:hypothetical protein
VATDLLFRPEDALNMSMYSFIHNGMMLVICLVLLRPGGSSHTGGLVGTSEDAGVFRKPLADCRCLCLTACCPERSLIENSRAFTMSVLPVAVGTPGA